MTSLFNVAFLLFLFPSRAADPGYLNSTGVIRVGIIDDAAQVTLHARGAVHATDMASGEKFALARNSDYSAGAESPARVKIGNLTLNSQVRLTPVEGEDRIKINGRPYRGSLLLKANTNQTITIVEELGIEEYLYGVLPLEMSPDWPLEALKAQAVASRTFALKNMGKFNGSGFDISADVRSQVYGGSGFDSPRILEAVRSTSGEVLTYKGELIPAYFHACCGGHTTAPSSVWGAETMRPLAGIADPYCRKSFHHAWRTYVTNKDILEALQRNGSSALKLRGIRIAKRDRSGRALSIKVITDQDNQTVSADNFRKWIGTDELKSTYILRIARTKGGYELAGRGWGHGAGLCQSGAKVMAERKKKYRAILQHYYPGAKITNWQD